MTIRRIAFVVAYTIVSSATCAYLSNPIWVFLAGSIVGLILFAIEDICSRHKEG